MKTYSVYNDPDFGDLTDDYFGLFQTIFHTPEGYFIFRPEGGYLLVNQKEMAVKEAYRYLLREHGERWDRSGKTPKDSNFTVASTFVKKYIKSVKSTTVMPQLGRLVEDRGQIILNIWSEHKLKSIPQTQLAYPILRLLHQNICGQKPVPDEEILECTNVQFIYLMSYLAHLYRHPGEPTLTAPFILAAKGAGKDITISIIKALMGAEYVGNANNSDIFNNFNRSVQNRIAVNWNEVQNLKSRNMISLLDQFISSQSFPLRGKHTDRPIDVPCIAHHFFWANRLPQWRIDKDERRLVFIQGADGETDDYKKISSDTGSYLYKNAVVNYTPDEKAVRAFAHVLEEYQIREQMMFKAPSTPLKRKIVSGVATIITEWLNDPSVTNNTHSVQHLLLHYNTWLHRYYRNNKPMNIKEFGTELTELVETLSYLEKVRKNKGIHYRISKQELPPDNEEKGVLASDLAPIEDGEVGTDWNKLMEGIEDKTRQ